jgi:hypothetical protein
MKLLIRIDDETGAAVEFDRTIPDRPTPSEILEAATQLAARLVEELRFLGGMSPERPDRN